jgi:hypothetical protein
MLGIADSVIGVAGKVLDKFVGDKDLKVKLEAELNKELISLDLAQAQANIEQAKHPSIFVSGARPAIMWVCCFALAWQFIIAPISSWVIITWYPMVTLPMLETGELVSLIMALLGLGAARSFEKYKGVARNNMKK